MLWLLCCDQSIANITDDYIESIKSHSGLESVESSLVLYYTKLITSGKMTIFKEERSELNNRLINLENVYPGYILKRIDKKIIKEYFLYQGKKLERLSEKNPGKKVFKKYLEIKNNELEVSFFDDLIQFGQGRGVYYYKENSIMVDFVETNSLMLVLIHELTHFFDKEAKDVRNNLDQLYEEIKFYSDVDLLNAFNNKTFGRYWFLETVYLKRKFHEAKAIYNTCMIVDEMNRLGVKLDLSLADRGFYKNILNRKKSCSRFVNDLLGINELEKMSLFWDKNTPKHKAVTSYIYQWFKENGFEY